jgi:glycosyltransferase involved in cell wall biosynthesis
VDLLFSWPPNGGADVDLYHTVSQLQAAGHEVRLFGAKCDLSWERGNFDPAVLPFPASRLDFAPREINGRAMPLRFRRALDEWRPDAVFVCDGFFLKPHVVEALDAWPLIARYYAYELACPRDSHLFRNGALCPNNYLRTPDECRRCALVGVHAEEIKHWSFHSWTQEYMAARAWQPGFHARLLRSLRACRTIVVSNTLHTRQLEGLHPDVRILPGGVNTAEYATTPVPVRTAGDKKIILMTGRVEDPMKGLKTLREAGERLAASRGDFEIHITHTDHTLNSPWLKAVGWHTPTAIRALYAQADMAVVPSIWQEPFGLVAVEAMASGRPVCASRVGGLQDIVLEGETGLLFDAGDAEGLARCLARLLDDGPLRSKMGVAARDRAETQYDWRRIVERYYPPILEGLRP